MDKPLLRVLAGHCEKVPPLWLMRQAGRYLREYRELRGKAGSFLELCFNPKLAAEVTLQPIRRFGFDAAILFSDILVVPHALGQRVRFEEGEGPRLEPIEDPAALGRVRRDIDQKCLDPIYQTISRVKDELPASVAFIGFCGAPWTVATYMIAGAGTVDQAPARLFAYRFPEAFAELIRYFGGCFGKLLDPASSRRVSKPYRFLIPGPEFCRPASLSAGASILARELSSGCARRFRMRKSSAFRAERHRACRNFSTASPSTLSVSIGWPNLVLSGSAFSRYGQFKAISIPWC